jgi:HprK-related kinase A
VSTLVALGAPALRRRLQGEGLLLRTGPFTYRLRSRLDLVAEGLLAMYPQFEVQDQGLADFHLRVDAVGGLRRWYRPQVNAWLDGFTPFLPLPVGQAYALLEWAMNFCVAGHAHHYLLLHAACLERHGRCVILPGQPGSGKSTLTAALMLSGWRLLSDEITLVDREQGALHALARPVSLKNASIDVIRGFAPGARIGPLALDTHKGSVAHLQPSSASVEGMQRRGEPACVVFPRWRAGADTAWSARGKAEAFEQLARNGFNYSMLGRLGFELIESLIDRSSCWSFEYSRLDEAIPAFERLAQEGRP